MAMALESSGKVLRKVRIFVSYPHSYLDYVKDIQQRLEDRGFYVWSDRPEVRAGDDFGTLISEEMKNSDMVLLVVGTDYKGKWCEFESAIAHQRRDEFSRQGIHFPVIPIRINENWDASKFERLSHIPWQGTISDLLANKFPRESLFDEICSEITIAAPPARPVWNMASPNPFYGRDDVFTDIEKEKVPCMLIRGLEGSGKATAIANFAGRQAFRLAWRIHAESTETLNKDLRDLGLQLGLTVREAANRHVVIEALGIITDWVICIEDAKVPLDINLPSSGRAFITSSIRDSTFPYPWRDVGPLTLEQACALFHNRSRNTYPRADVERLVERLGMLPGAVTRAAASIDDGISPTEYLAELWRNHPMSEEWEHHFKPLTSGATRLLQVLAFLPDRERLPAEILNPFRMPLTVRADCSGPNRRKILRELRRHCLVDGDDAAFSISLPVQDVIRARMIQEWDSAEYVSAADRILRASAGIISPGVRFRGHLTCAKFLEFTRQSGAIDIIERALAEDECPSSIREELKLLKQSIDRHMLPSNLPPDDIREEVTKWWKELLDNDLPCAACIAVLVHLSPEYSRRSMMERHSACLPTEIRSLLEPANWADALGKYEGMLILDRDRVEFDREASEVIRGLLTQNESAWVDAAVEYMAAVAMADRAGLRQCELALRHTRFCAGVHFGRVGVNQGDWDSLRKSLSLLDLATARIEEVDDPRHALYYAWYQAVSSRLDAMERRESTGPGGR